jgi:hypothetical protein
MWMKNRIHKILGIGLSAGLVFALVGAIFAAPAAAGQMKWTTVNTPDWGDLVIYPGTDILDYDIGPDGDTIFAILELGCLVADSPRDRSCDDSCGDVFDDYALVKSTDGGVTWTDITCNVFNAASIPDCTTGDEFTTLSYVSVAQDDEDWLAVIGWSTASKIWVVASKDGGSNFAFAGEVADPTGDTLTWVFDMDVSMEVDGIHNIAVAGIDNGAHGWKGAIFRLKAGTWLTGAWEDTGAWLSGGPPIVTDYLGWDTNVQAVIACEFSPNFDMDDTIVCMGTDGLSILGGCNAVIQSGIWEAGGGAWNTDAGFPGSKIVKADGESITTAPVSHILGLSLPDDFDGTDPGMRAMFLYVDGVLGIPGIIGGWLMRSDNYALSPVTGPSGDPLLASIDTHGDVDTGKLMIGGYVQWDTSGAHGDIWGWGAPVDVFADGATYCGGVSVWHTEELDFCCPQWDGCCKKPSGPYMALVMYTPDGEKEYASTSGRIDPMLVANINVEFGVPSAGWTPPTGLPVFQYAPGTPLDESAFSISRDDAVSFNQIGLIDTDIHNLSDVAVCPDCGTIYLSSNNDGREVYCIECGDGYSDCDSIWRSYDDGATWERVFYGDWKDANGYDTDLLLRLPCDAIEDCCDQDPVAPSGTVYLGLRWNDQIFYSRDCGQCWNNPPATKEPIVDFAVESENIVYVLDGDGKVSKSTQYGRRWSTPVDTKVGSGHSITACCEEGSVVVGPASVDCGGKKKVAWSEDGGETWTQTDNLPADATGDVHVACAPNCENIIYAAVDGDGIYRCDITDGSWTDMTPLPYDYTGIVVAREGTLYASTDDINTVDSTSNPYYAFTDCKGRYMATDCGDHVYSGVARNLTPCDTACCGTEDWDYLFCGMTAWGPQGSVPDGEVFSSQPTALRICGCLSADTNSVLWAIDVDHYEMSQSCVEFKEYMGRSYPNGALWYYEDCAAKHGPTLTSPADGAVLPCQACAGCDSSPFTLQWERMCLACSYDIVIMDEDGNQITSFDDKTITGDPPELYVEYGLECGNTYTWKVREANTSCECIHSPWSETWSFTVAVGAADAIKLLAPDEGKLGVQIANVGFSWSSVREASSYSFVLSPNAALTGAIVSQDMSSTAFNYSGPLDYSKSYYWQVKAWKDGTLLTTSAIGVFSTMAEPEEPTPPVVIEETPTPVLEIPPAEQITPTWIYAIIGIGAALAVVVIVLIVRSRRP